MGSGSRAGGHGRRRSLGEAGHPAHRRRPGHDAPPVASSTGPASKLDRGRLREGLARGRWVEGRGCRPRGETMAVTDDAEDGSGVSLPRREGREAEDVSGPVTDRVGEIGPAGGLDVVLKGPRGSGRTRGGAASSRHRARRAEGGRPAPVEDGTRAVRGGAQPPAAACGVELIDPDVLRREIGSDDVLGDVDERPGPRRGTRSGGCSPRCWPSTASPMPRSAMRCWTGSRPLGLRQAGRALSLALGPALAAGRAAPDASDVAGAVALVTGSPSRARRRSGPAPMPPRRPVGFMRFPP